MPTEAPPAPPPAAPAAPAPAPSKPTAIAPAPAKPSQSAVPASKPAPVSKPVSKPAENLNDAFAQLDAMGEPNPSAELQGKDAPAKPADQPTGDKPDDKAADAPDAPAKPGDEPAKQPPAKAATLREALDRTKAENAALQKKIAEYEAEKAKTPVEDPEKKKLSETLAEREKRLSELEEEQRFSNYERSQEYQEKWNAPFVSAYEAGRARVRSLTLTDENGAVRQGTDADFDAIMRITDNDAAAERAAEVFGNKASMVMYHREKAVELNQARLNALDEFRKNGAERDQKRQAEWKATSEKVLKEATETWQKARTAPHEKYPLFFKPIEGDTEGNTLLENGFKEADEAFSHMNPLDPRLTSEQRAQILQRHATIYNKAAAFNRLAHLLKKERTALRAAEAKLKEFEASEPGRGDGKGGGGPALSTWDSIDAQLAKLAK
jgi:hypothetical protein